MSKENVNCVRTAGSSTEIPELRLSLASCRSILLWDTDPHRCAMVTETINMAGGIARVYKGPVTPEASQLSPCGTIALVGVGHDFHSENPAGLTITACKNAGLTVIAYGTGAKQWPVRSKCLPLLAGAAHLLDSGTSVFSTELRQLLEETVRAVTAQRRETQGIWDGMLQHGLVGQSCAITEVFRAAMRYSDLSDLPVLITGESGTGKELVARAIGAMDPKRKDGPFVAINCAAINPTLMESEFFGHRRGAFTGAERDRKGLIRAAEGGTLFLDEIGELDIRLQAKLLRVLQENHVLTVGDEREMPVNVRFMAATNQNLEHLVAERQFRSDLFHRLRVLSLHIPPLRERPADIPPLVKHFLQKGNSLQTGSVVDATEDFLEGIRQLDLPGNVRQLENLIYHSLAHHQTSRPLDLNDLPAEVIRLITSRTQVDPHQTAGMAPHPRKVLSHLSQPQMNELVKQILDDRGWNLSEALCECERHVFEAAMQRTGGNQSQAARLLGITSRSVYNKVHKFQLHS